MGSLHGSDVFSSINQSINQSKHISIAPYVATNQRRIYYARTFSSGTESEALAAW